MRPVDDPDTWAATLRSFQTATLRAELYSPYGHVRALPGFDGGSVTLDGTAAVRGSCTLTFSDPDLVPTDFDSPLAPYGQEIRVWRGLYDAAGQGQEISLGVFRIQDTDWEDTADGLTITVNAFDRAQIVSEDTVVADGSGIVQIPEGDDYVTTIRNIIKDALPTVQFDSGSGWSQVHVTPLITMTEGDDRWAAVQDMAAVIKCNLYFDGDGICAMRRIPDPTDPPAEELVEGENGLLVSATTTWTRENSPNRVVYTGESTDNGVTYRYDKKDDDPNSPTFYDKSPGFGKVNSFEQSDKITSDQMAQQAAEGQLLKVKGTSKSIDFGTIVNPALEPNDVVIINRERSGIFKESHIIDSLTIPLNIEEPMTGSTRAVQVK